MYSTVHAAFVRMKLMTRVYEYGPTILRLSHSVAVGYRWHYIRKQTDIGTAINLAVATVAK